MTATNMCSNFGSKWSSPPPPPPPLIQCLAVVCAVCVVAVTDSVLSCGMSCVCGGLN